MSNHKSSRLFGGKGYYIALILCATAIGVMGYVYSRQSENTPVDSLDVAVTASQPTAGSETTQPSQSGQEPPQTEQTTEATVGKLAVTVPVEGEMITEYAMEVLSYNETTRDWRTHNGVDFAAEGGTKVVAAAAGEVYTVYEDERLGHTVVIRHDDGYVTKYASLAPEISVAPGDVVALGQTIGAVGSSALMETALGDHLHFSVTQNNEAVNPQDFLNQ